MMAGLIMVTNQDNLLEILCIMTLDMALALKEGYIHLDRTTMITNINRFTNKTSIMDISFQLNAEKTIILRDQQDAVHVKGGLLVAIELAGEVIHTQGQTLSLNCRQ